MSEDKLRKLTERVRRDVEGEGVAENGVEPARGVTVGRLTPVELFARLDGSGTEHLILAEVICGMYWGGRAAFDLQRLELLSPDNWQLAVEIMGYRRSEYWSEAQFHVIARWCRERHGLATWQGED